MPQDEATIRKLVDLIATMKNAGFYANGIETIDGCWSRVTVCNDNRADVLGGNSIWVTSLLSDWYLGTWGGQVYRVPEKFGIGAVCISWLSQMNTLQSDLSLEIKNRFQLTHVTDEEFDRLTGSDRTRIEELALTELVERKGIVKEGLVAEAEWDGDSWQVLIWKSPANEHWTYAVKILRNGHVRSVEETFQ